MTSEQMGGFAARPPAVAEWEDLLVRLEIVPRVVSSSLGEWDAGEATAAALREAAQRELRVGRWLETAAAIEPSERAVLEGAGTEELARLFASLRARTFAMVQRRGLEVWDWSGPLDDGESATAYQVLRWLAGKDAELLAALRGAAPNAGPVGEVESETAVDS